MSESSAYANLAHIPCEVCLRRFGAKEDALHTRECWRALALRESESIRRERDRPITPRQWAMAAASTALAFVGSWAFESANGTANALEWAIGWACLVASVNLIVIRARSVGGVV